MNQGRKCAKGGYIPGPPTAGPGLKLTPGEYIVNPDGRIWQVTDDGERIELIRGPREDDE